MSNNLYQENLFASNTSDEDRTEENIKNPYLSYQDNSTEQDLVRQQTAESIQMYGDEFIYVRRTLINVDDILGEDMENCFESGWKIVAYIENFEDYSGQKDYYGNFGLQIDDQLELTIEPKLFLHQVDNNPPCSGDLIYWPRGKGLFEITWNEDDNPFFTNGIKTQFKLDCQKFLYSGETVDVINNGTIDTIDQQPFDDINELDGKVDTFEPEGREGDQIQTEGDLLESDINEDNPFGINI